MSHPLTQALVGSAAVGKTTLTTRLAAQLGLNAYVEDAEDNPLLTEWYLNPRRWNVWVLMFFHSRRTVQHLLAHAGGGVMERTPWDDRIFLELALASASSEGEREHLLRIQAECERLLALQKAPDFLVYLKVSYPVQCVRIHGRQRDKEEQISELFMHSLNAKYEEHFGEGGHHRPTLTIDTDHLSLDEVEAQILRHVRGEG